MNIQNTVLAKRNIRDLIRQEFFSYYSAIICVVVLPFNAFYLPPFMILWGIARAIEVYVNKDYKVDRDVLYRMMILFIVFFACQLISLFYSDNIRNGINVLFSRLSLIIFPLLMVFAGNRIKEKVNSLLKLFSFSTTLLLIVCFVIALLKSISIQNGELIFNSSPDYFSSSYFSFNQHPSYLAMYSILSLFISLEILLKEQRIWRKIFWILSVSIIFIGIYLLSSRAGFIAVLSCTVLYTFLKFDIKKKNYITLATSVFIILISLLILVTNDRMRWFLNNPDIESFNDKIENDGRIIIWKSSFNIIRYNPLFGVGIGDAREELVDEYMITENEDLIENRYNAHNQFIEILLETGIVGLIAFLSILGLMIYIVINRKNILLGIFLFDILIFFSVETVLYRLAGVAFFSLFSFLLVHLKKEPFKPVASNTNNEHD